MYIHFNYVGFAGGVASGKNSHITHPPTMHGDRDAALNKGLALLSL
jgi:hypothetical protein